MSTITTKISNFLIGGGCLLPVLAIVFFIYALFNHMGFFGFIIVIVTVIIAIMIMVKAKNLEDQELIKQREQLANLKRKEMDFSKLPTIISSDALTRMVMDDEKQRIYLWLAVDRYGNPMKRARFNMQYRFFNYAFKDLVAIATVIDGNIRSSSPSYVNEHLANFIKQEPAANGTSVDNVKRISLIIQIDNKKHPFYPIRFYHDPYKTISKESPEYISAVEKMHEWYEKMDAIMDKTERMPDLQKQHQNPPLKTSAPIKDRKETIEPTIVEEVIEVPTIEREVIEKVDNERPTYSLNADPVKEISISKDTSTIDNKPVEKKELSYFEQLVEKNKKQLNDRHSNDKDE